MVMQDPKYSLNPVMRVGRQIIEAYRAHTRASAAEARDKTLAMLEAVQLRDPRRVMRAYPPQQSRGLGQRAINATMMVTDPALPIAHAPTSPPALPPPPPLRAPPAPPAAPPAR